MNVQLAQRLEALLEGELSLDDFSAWLWEFTWDVGSIPEQDRPSVLNVQNAFAELTGGHVSRDEFFDYVRPMLRKPAIVISFSLVREAEPVTPMTSTSSGQTIRVPASAAYG